MKKRILIILSFIMIFVLAFSVQAFADGNIDFDKRASIKVDTGLPGTLVSLYRVGNLNSEGGCVLTESMQDYAVDVHATGSDASEAARALEAFLIRDKVKPSAEKESDENGSAGFYGLELGLYLVSCNDIGSGTEMNVFSPILISLPALLDGEWRYDVSTNVKWELQNGQTYCKVKKVWAGENAVPEAVTVQLLKDGTVYDEQLLSEDNNWSYTWSELPEDNRWIVIEKNIPEGYTLGLSVDGFVYTLKNTSDSGEPGYEEDEGDWEEYEEEPGDEEESDKAEKLPQTGQMWWPVPVLVMVGLVLILIGVWSRRTEKRESE